MVSISEAGSYRGLGALRLNRLINNIKDFHMTRLTRFNRTGFALNPKAAYPA